MERHKIVEEEVVRVGETGQITKIEKFDCLFTRFENRFLSRKVAKPISVFFNHCMYCRAIIL